MTSFRKQHGPKACGPKNWDKIDIVGIDGEGEGDKPHRYTLLAASDGYQKRCVEAYSLDTYQCLEFLCSLHDVTDRQKLFVAFSFTYDLTMMLKDLPSSQLYLLQRPELRTIQRDEHRVVMPIKWRGFKLNLQSTKFTVEDCRGQEKRMKIVVWDLFRFFGCAFTKALTDWGIRSKEQLASMQMMKDSRANFASLDAETIREYCYSECGALSELARKLILSHQEGGLELKKFYGAGSSGEAMLGVLEAKSKIVKESDEMKIPVACAFFGGRFERSHRGLIKGDIYDYDISSAYPYAMYRVPCIICGKWSYTQSERRIEDARAALVQVSTSESRDEVWGPFPFRDEKGTIRYPIKRGPGWIWKDEYLAGRRNFSNVNFLGAYVYESDCACRPWERVKEFYLQRLRMGKDGAGLAIKLGLNSCYGKTAQSRGSANPPFQCWIIAGMITSMTRAMMLDMIGLHRDRRNLLSIATDGIKTRERIDCPEPLSGMRVDCAKPLGGWEEKKHEGDIFMVREGIHYLVRDGIPIDCRARGIGRNSFRMQYDHLVECFERGDSHVVLDGGTRFHSMKSSIHYAARKHIRRACYGQWVRAPICLSFAAAPKRQESESRADLYLPPFHEGFEGMSQPYDAAMIDNMQRINARKGIIR